MIFNEPERFGEGIATYGSRDASLYAKMAWQLINEGFYGYNADVPNAYVTPGQPFYLVAIFKAAQIFHTNHIMLYRVANMILNLSILVLIYAISLKLFKRIAIGAIAALIYASHFAPLHLFRTALTEIPTIFLMLCCMYLFLLSLEKDKFGYYTLFGIVAAITLMFRATPAPLLLLGWAIVIYKFGFKKAVGIGFIWCIGPVLIFTPWVVRNYLLFKETYLFSSHAGGPMLAGTNAFHLLEHSQLMKEAASLGLSEEEYAKVRMKEEFFRDIPLFVSWMTVGKTIWLFIEPQGKPEGLGPYIHYLPDFIKNFYIAQNAITSFGGLLLAFLLRKRARVNMLALMVLIYIVFSNMFLTLPRYGFLIYPILAMIFAYGVVYYGERMKEKFVKIKNNKRDRTV
jgi:4-amino-4-deoxy-L-arabinose transferase-like glycosyltransferase